MHSHYTHTNPFTSTNHSHDWCRRAIRRTVRQHYALMHAKMDVCVCTSMCSLNTALQSFRIELALHHSLPQCWPCMYYERLQMPTAFNLNAERNALPFQNCYESSVISKMCIGIERTYKEILQLDCGVQCQGFNGGSCVNMQCLSLSLPFPSPISSPSFSFRQIFCLADIPTSKSPSEESFKVKRGGREKNMHSQKTASLLLSMIP